MRQARIFRSPLHAACRCSLPFYDFYHFFVESSFGTFPVMTSPRNPVPGGPFCRVDPLSSVPSWPPSLSVFRPCCGLPLRCCLSSLAIATLVKPCSSLGVWVRPSFNLCCCCCCCCWSDFSVDADLCRVSRTVCSGDKDFVVRCLLRCMTCVDATGYRTLPNAAQRVCCCSWFYTVPVLFTSNPLLLPLHTSSVLIYMLEQRHNLRLYTALAGNSHAHSPFLYLSHPSFASTSPPPPRSGNMSRCFRRGAEKQMQVPPHTQRELLGR